MPAFWEKLRALLPGGRAVTKIGGDQFPIAENDPLFAVHEQLSEFLRQNGGHSWYYELDLKASEVGRAIAASTPEAACDLVIALLRRLAHLDVKMAEFKAKARDRNNPQLDSGWEAVWNPRQAFQQVLRALLRRKLPLEVMDVEQLLQWVNAGCENENVYSVLYLYPGAAIVGIAESLAEEDALSSGVADELTQLGRHLRRDNRDKDSRKLANRIDTLLGTAPDIPLQPGEVWADQARRDIEAAEEKQVAWGQLLTHCQTVSGGAPSAKWRKAAEPPLEAIGWDEFKKCMLVWFPLVDKPRMLAAEINSYGPQSALVISDAHAEILKGLVWLCGQREDAELARALSALALSAYKKIPGLGPRLVSVGNACIWALGNMPGMQGVGQLALLKVRVKFGTAQKMIEKALVATAARVGLPREDLEEMAVPAYGMNEVGLRRETFGDYTAELAVTGTADTELRWFKPDGKPQKTTPAAVKEQFKEDLKELTQAGKDIEKMLTAQRERLDQLHLARKTWAYPVWRERYLDHPLVGVLARRLIWRFTRATRQGDAIRTPTAREGPGHVADGIFLNGGLVDSQNKPLDWPDADTQVELWHPVGKDAEEILAWRRWLEEHEVQQPFKQAHREIYLLTDAERNTRVYSNRFAAHIIRQHQFNALCAARGWKNKLRLMVDDEYPPASLSLPRWNLRAEFWVEGVGDQYGRDTNETGTYLYLATDQVRFYALDAIQMTAHADGGGYGVHHRAEPEPIPLERIPPLVLSEVLRDVDLFVGVASVGNDPNWADGGPDGQHREYWSEYAFGGLGASAQTRKAVLERLIPRLKIAGRCSFTDKFLVVRGDLRTYKIHLGSSNILMEPNDQYLCIVPNRRPAGSGTNDRVFLPFEGDERLAVILSKAFLLAEDKKISDPTIVSQIQRGREGN